MNVPIVWVMGVPGSGKSTLSQNIVNKYGYKHLDPSEMVEREIEAKTERGVELAAKRNNGEELKLSDIIHILDGEVMSLRGGIRGFVIDGYPQNQGDANILEERIGAPDLVISLQVNQTTAETRNSARGSVLTATVSHFAMNAAPVLAQYSNKLILVNGEREAQVIFEGIIPNIENINKNHGNPITIEH